MAGIVGCGARGQHTGMDHVVCTMVRWTARGLALLIAGGFLVFLAGEPVGPLGAIHFREWVGMVLIFGTVAGMLLAWKWEFPAALISMFTLAAFAAVVHMQNYAVLAIAAIPNILFLLDWKLRRLHPARMSKTA